MPFSYRLQKILEIRIRKKEEQLQAVLKAQSEVDRIELLIMQNLNEIKSLTKQMREANPLQYNAYDKFIKHLWQKDQELNEEKNKAIEKLEEEKKLLQQREQEVNVLEKHKENQKEIYVKEQKARELKELSEIGSQKHFLNKRAKNEEEKQN